MPRRHRPHRSVALGVAALLSTGLLAAPTLGASPDPTASMHPDAVSTHLLEDLGRVPDTADTRGDLLGWLDHRAVEDARPGAAHPATLADLQAGLDVDDPAAQRWLAAFMGVASGSSELMTGLLGIGADWPEVVGFDPMAIDRQLTFGAPPATGLVLTGRFAPEAIGAALGARGFVSQPADGDVVLWCGPAGCDAGLEMDLADREIADPFGGRIGRKQPLAVSSSALLSSVDLATIEGMLAATTDVVPSLADDPAWAAAAGALAGEGTTLIQATFVPSPLLLADPAAILLADPSLADLRAWVEAQRAAGFRAIPPATLLAVGDAATGTEQVVTLALTYPTLADAQVAAEVIPERLAQMPSLRVARPWSEVLGERGVTSIAGTAVETASGGGVAAVTLRAPLAGDDPDDTGRLPASSQLYRLFIEAIATRDLGFLATDLPPVD
jgi:hypothetical protein